MTMKMRGKKNLNFEKQRQGIVLFFTHFSLTTYSNAQPYKIQNPPMSKSLTNQQMKIINLTVFIF